jgi:23S rRNA (uracil1939-C5)-methyltransferase
MEHVVDITAVAHGGHGITRIDGQVCFVPFGLPGDRARIAIAREQKGVLWATLLEIVEPSPHRAPSPCLAAVETGACMWSQFAYPGQAAWKVQIVRDSFARIGKMEVEPAWRDVPELRVGYRTRAEFHVQHGRIGYYALGSHDVIDVPACPLSHPRLNDALARLRTWRPQGAVEITINPEGDEVLVWTRHPDAEVERVFPQAQHMRSEEPRAQFIFDGVPIVNGCFSQSSLLLNRLLVQTVHDQLKGAATLLDLYCGTGNFSLTLPSSIEVTGIDHNRAAVAAAGALGRGRYLAGDESVMAKTVLTETWDGILLDPPRSGAKPLVEALASSRAAAMVYVSCDPATLARDVKLLHAQGWMPRTVEVIDMFPHTPHVETVCVLDRC